MFSLVDNSACVMHHLLLSLTAVGHFMASQIALVACGCRRSDLGRQLNVLNWPYGDKRVWLGGHRSVVCLVASVKKRSS